MVTSPEALEIAPSPEPDTAWPQEFAELDLDCLDPDPNQPRGMDPGDNLEELAFSLKTDGILAPLRVRPSETPGRFTIEIGFRRFQGLKLAGEKKALCLIDRRPPDPLRLLRQQIAENLHRADIKPCQFARALLRLRELGNYTQVQLAEAIGKGKDAAFVSRKLALITRFSQAHQDAIDDGRLDESTANHIATIPDKHKDKREALADRAIRDKLPREKVIQLVTQLKRKPSATPPAARSPQRLHWCHPGGATVAVTAPDGIELTTDEVFTILDYALHHVSKANKKGLSVHELPAYFKERLAKAEEVAAKLNAVRLNGHADTSNDTPSSIPQLSP